MGDNELGLRYWTAQRLSRRRLLGGAVVGGAALAAMGVVGCKTGKKTEFGNTRSHSLRHARRTFKPNIQKKRVFDARTGQYRTMKVAASYLRTLAKRLQEGKMA